MVNQANIKAVITADDRASAAVSKFGSNVENTSSKVTRAFKTAAVAAGALAVTGIGAAVKASWDQVDAVQQATVALKAYEKDGSKVNSVLKGLVSYARSDLGVLFNRKDLFESAQRLKLMGDNTGSLVDHVKVLSRSVGLGLSTWDELNQIVGRVGSTGRLTGDDFDNLTKSGFKLDSSLRNSNITWDRLFKALNKGIPANALAGQANTIQGKMVRLQTAFRGVGDAILGVDRDTGRFIKGGLGDTAVKAVDGLTSALSDGGLKSALQGASQGLVGFINFGGSFLSQVGQMKGLVLGATTGFIAYKIAVIAMTTTTRAATAAQVALNLAMKLNPVALLIAGAVGIVAAFAQVVSSTNQNSNSSKGLAQARRELSNATQTAKNSENALKDAQLNQRGASLQVEQAQRAYNDAVKQYGPRSLEARQAAYILATANRALRDANESVRKKTKEAQKAESDKAAAHKKVVAASDAVARGAYREAGGFNAVARAAASAAKEEAKKGQGGKYVRPGTGSKSAKALFGIPGRAVGGPVSQGSPYMIGERGPELFVPSQSGKVLNNQETSNAVGGRSQTILNINFSGVFTGNEVEFRKLAKKVFQAHGDLSSMKMGRA